MVSLSDQEGNLSVWKGLCCSERALLRSTVEVGQLSAQAGNLSVWEGLYCSDRAPYQSVQALSGPKMLFRRSGKASYALREPYVSLYACLKGPYVDLGGSLST